MKASYSIFLAFFSLSVVATHALAKEVDETLQADPAGIVKIKSLRGELRVIGWSEDEVRVRGDLDELAEGLRFKVNGDQTIIEIKMPRQNVNWGDGSDLEIHVPSQSRVLIDAVSSDISAQNLVGGMQIRSISGEIELEDSAGAINLRTVSGEIQTEDTTGDIRATSSSGEVAVKSHDGNAHVESMSGELKLEATNVERLTGSTVSGEMNIQVELIDDVNAELTSVSGEIIVRLIDPDDLTIQAKSTSGDIDNDITDDEVKEKYGQRSLKAVIGDGSGTLGVRTVSGAIEIDEG